jgi:polyisoprenoid-binding protein YceI
MKKTSILLTAFSCLFFSLTSFCQTSWKFDQAHSNLGFSILHQLVNDVKGTVQITGATIVQTKEDFTDATITLKADLNTINSGNEKRDAHLKTADFFDTAKFPELSFQSNTFSKKSPDNYTTTGLLTLHGITKPVTLQVVSKSGTGMKNKPVTGFKVTGVIKRSDFDISSATPSAIISDDVNIEANLEFGKE